MPELPRLPRAGAVALVRAGPGAVRARERLRRARLPLHGLPIPAAAEGAAAPGDVPGDRKNIDYAHLEDLARAPLGQRVVDPKGWIAYIGHRVRVGRRFAGKRADLVLTLEGAEVLVDGVFATRFDYWAHVKDYSQSRGD